MTTVAYKDGILATDTLAVSDHKLQASVTKIMETESGFFAFAWSLIDFQPIVQLYEDIVNSGEEHPKDWPRIEHCTINQSSAAIFIPFGYNSNPQLLFVDDFGAMRICDVEADFIAIGSGSQFALGAMAAGASSEDAVRCAIMLDETSGGDVNSININAMVELEEEEATAQAVIQDFLKTQSKKQTAENLGMTKKEVKAYLKSVSEALSEE